MSSNRHDKSFGNGTKIKVRKFGTAVVSVSHEGRLTQACLHGTLLKPEAARNLISL